MVEADERPHRTAAPSAVACRARTLVPAGSAAARCGRSAQALATSGKRARPLAEGTCAPRKEIEWDVGGFSRTGTLAGPLMLTRGAAARQQCLSYYAD